MRKISFLLGFLLLLTTVTAAQESEQQIVQWAFRAEATSQYTDDAWSAAQATGAPDVFACEDNGNAWASLTIDEPEALTLYYREIVTPTQVNIYQSYTPGAITGIAIIPADGGDPIDIPRSADPGNAGCPIIFSVTLPANLPPSNGVVIYFDQTQVGDWNEIDAVELVGTVEGDPADSELASFELGAFPDYDVISNTGQRPTPSNNTGSQTNTQTSTQSDPPPASYDVAWGRDVFCRDGGSIEGGVEITIVQQRAGNQYRVTAVGLNGFDPVLAVMLTGAYSNALCNDDDSSAATYGAALPTTGRVDAARTSSQVIFNLNSGNAFENVSIVVGGFGGSSGEFLLIVEGMFASDADGAGDPFSLAVSPSLYESDVMPTAYMIAVTNNFDPFLYLSDGDYNALADDSGVTMACDDAGNASLCWGNHSTLSGSFVSRSQGRTLGGGSLDAMITAPIGQADVGYYVNYLMRGNRTQGDYVAAFHLGVAGQP